MGGCNWNFDSTQCFLNMCQIHRIACAIHGCKCSSKLHCTLKKNCSLRLNTRKYFQEQLLYNTAFHYGCYFIKIIVHLSVIEVVRYFSIYKLIGKDPANIYFFKANSRNTRQRYVICPNLTTNTIESRSGVFTVNFEVYLLLTEQVNVCPGALSYVNMIIHSLK